jgi:glutamyl/glutaminyl-tRNA synthetase|tara:strand:+ start:595 stop:822 length:228 start_codon:yes stop_codon:yes gene_type:complete
MNIFSIDLTQNEITFLRQALDLVTIKGTDAKFLANLQIKLEDELIQITKILRQEEEVKQQSLQDMISREEKKSKK